MSINSLQSEQLRQPGREQSDRLWGQARSWLRIAASSSVTFPDLTPSCCFWTPCKTSLSNMTSICQKQFFLSHLLTPGISHISSVRNTEAALGTIQPQVLIPGESLQSSSHHISAFSPKVPKAGNKCTLYWHQSPSKCPLPVTEKEGSSQDVQLNQRKKGVEVMALWRFYRGQIIPMCISQHIGKNSFTTGSHKKCPKISFLSYP